MLDSNSYESKLIAIFSGDHLNIVVKCVNNTDKLTTTYVDFSILRDYEDIVTVLLVLLTHLTTI